MSEIKEIVEALRRNYRPLTAEEAEAFVVKQKEHIGRVMRAEAYDLLSAQLKCYFRLGTGGQDENDGITLPKKSGLIFPLKALFYAYERSLPERSSKGHPFDYSLTMEDTPFEGVTVTTTAKVSVLPHHSPAFERFAQVSYTFFVRLYK
jgi:hypothetical protein